MITGLLGVVGGSLLPAGKIIANVYDKQKERKHEKQMKEFELEELRQKVAIAKIEGNSELKAQMIEASKEAIKSATEDRKSARTHDAAKYTSTLSEKSPKLTWVLFTIVDALRGLVRPLITFGVLALFAAAIFFPENNTMLNDTVIKATLTEVLFVCIAFWFGDKVAEGVEKKK